jgi:hypothetical protein
MDSLSDKGKNEGVVLVFIKGKDRKEINKKSKAVHQAVCKLKRTHPLWQNQSA